MCRKNVGEFAMHIRRKKVAFLDTQRMVLFVVRVKVDLNAQVRRLFRSHHTRVQSVRTASSISGSGSESLWCLPSLSSYLTARFGNRFVYVSILSWAFTSQQPHIGDKGESFVPSLSLPEEEKQTALNVNLHGDPRSYRVVQGVCVNLFFLL